MRAGCPWPVAERLAAMGDDLPLARRLARRRALRTDKPRARDGRSGTGRARRQPLGRNHRQPSDHRGRRATRFAGKSMDVNAMRWSTPTGVGSCSIRIGERSRPRWWRTASPRLTPHLPVHPARLRRQRICRGEGHHGHVDRSRIVRKNPDQSASLLTRGAGSSNGSSPGLGEIDGCQDFEATIDSARVFLYAASVMLLVRRIARASRLSKLALRQPVAASSSGMGCSHPGLDGAEGCSTVSRRWRIFSGCSSSRR